MAPLTKPAFMSMLCLSMTCAPTASFSTASNPAVLLQSLFSFSSFSAAFLFHLLLLFVSSTSSVHNIFIFLSPGTVKAISARCISVQFDHINDPCDIEKVKMKFMVMKNYFQFSLILAYAVTIHKCQISCFDLCLHYHGFTSPT